jgi:hypothetical protein
MNPLLFVFFPDLSPVIEIQLILQPDLIKSVKLRFSLLVCELLALVLLELLCKFTFVGIE